LHVWDVTTQKEPFAKKLPEEMNRVAFSPDGKLVAVAGAETKTEEPRDHEIKVWEVPGGGLYASLKGPEYCIVRSMTFSPDGRSLATGLSVNLVRVWDVRAKKPSWVQKVSNDYRLLTFSKDGKQLVAGGYELITVLDAANGAVTKTHRLPGSPVTDMVAADPGHLLYAKKQVVFSFDLATGEKKMLFPKEDAEAPGKKKGAGGGEARGASATSLARWPTLLVDGTGVRNLASQIAFGVSDRSAQRTSACLRLSI
jgi:WD40 repeat protein